jgi:hypothetical protein
MSFARFAFQACSIDHSAARSQTKADYLLHSLRIRKPNFVAGCLGRNSQLVSLGLRPSKSDENRRARRMAPVGAARSNQASGAIEAEQLFDPERA